MESNYLLGLQVGDIKHGKESSGPRLLKLPTVNSVHKQVENNYLRVFPRSPPKFIYDCEKHLYKAAAYIGVRIKWRPRTMHS